MEIKTTITEAGQFSGEFDLRGDDGIIPGATAKLVFVGMTSHIVTITQKMEGGEHVPVLKISSPVLCEVIGVPDGGTYKIGVASGDPCPSPLTAYVRQ